jgi:hypothetical protein
MTLHDFPFVKKWGIKKLIFSDFRYFKGMTGPYVMESRGDAYHNVNSNHNIYAISPVLLFGCESNVGPKFQIILNCITYLR